MSFTENLKINIETQLDAGAFKKLKAQLATVNIAMNNMQSPLDQGEMFAGFTEKAEMLEDKLQGLNLKPRAGEDQAMFTDTRTGVPVSENQAAMRKFRDEMNKSKIAAANLSEQANTVSFSKGITSADRMRNTISGAVQEAQNIKTPEIDAGNREGGANRSFAGEAVRKAGLSQNVGATQMERSLEKVRSQATPTTRTLGNTSGVTNKLGYAFSVAKTKAGNFNGSLRGMIPSLQNLQMQLLGVQFSLLSLAFIFGGLMMGAMGAVGIFEILGNTLKMFFLPTALSLLPIVLDIREALLGVSQETKELVGRVFLITSAVGAFGSILAFTASGLLGLLQGIKTLFSPVLKLGGLLTKFGPGGNGIIATLKAFGSGGILGGIKAVLVKIMAFSPHILLLIGVVTTLFTIFQRFPGLTKAIFARLKPVIQFVQLLFKNALLMIKGVFNVIQGVVTMVLGLMTGQTDKAVAGMKEAFLGLTQIIVKPFINLMNFLIDTVLPLIADFSTMMPKLVVKGLMGIGTVLSDALEAVLPDWIFNRLEPLLEGAGDIGDAVLNGLNAPKRAAEKFAKNTEIKQPDIGQDFKPSSGKGKSGETKKQENNVNIGSVEVNDSEETPFETGQKVSEGITTGLNNRSSSIFSSGT